MSSVVIVAIPSDDDPVWKVSSEPIPHMTMVYLGEMDEGPELARIETFLQHMATDSIAPFGLTVDRRGTLGEDDADVLFFDKEFIKPIEQVRQGMLGNNEIRAAYNNTEQYPEWTPHLTLGYPATPAHIDTREYPSFHWVNFDRIALWFGDSEGPEFRLEDRREVAMSDIYGGVVLTHHGVKGQKWGVRRDKLNSSIDNNKAGAAVKKELKERTGTEVIVRNRPGEGVRTVGGNKQLAHPDAVKVRTAEQIVKRSTTDAISTKDLQELVTRMNLEQQYRNLAVNEYRTTVGEKYATELLQSSGTALAKKVGLGDTASAAVQDIIAKQTGNKALTGGKVKTGDNSNKSDKKKDD